MYKFFLSLMSLFVFATTSPVFAQRGPTPVFVQEVQLHSLSEKIEALGTLRANESTVLSASVTETITAIRFDDNQHVSAGDVLVEMTSAEEHAQLEQAISALDEAERQYARLKSLQKSKLTTEAQLDQQKGVVDAATAQLRAVQSRLQDRLILAPFDGVVGLRNISVGALVRPGDVITTLDDISVMKLDMTIPSVHLNKLRVGMDIVASVNAYKNVQFKGTLASIDSRVDPVTRSVVARALIPNPQGTLRPGLLMTVALRDAAREALAVAEEAVIQVGQQAHVFVVTGDDASTVEKRNVSLGVRQGDIVEISEGLNRGELVVIHGGLKLRPGSEVRITARSNDNERLSELLAK